MENLGTEYDGGNAQGTTSDLIDEPAKAPTETPAAPTPPETTSQKPAQAQWDPTKRGRAPYWRCEKDHHMLDPETQRPVTLREKRPNFCVRCERGEPAVVNRPTSRRTAGPQTTAIPVTATDPTKPPPKKTWTADERAALIKLGDTLHGPAMMLSSVVSDFAESWSSIKTADGKTTFPGFALDQSIVPTAYWGADGSSQMAFMFGDEAMATALKQYAGIAGPEWLAHPMTLPTITMVTVLYTVVMAKRHQVRVVDMRPRRMQATPHERQPQPTVQQSAPQNEGKNGA